MDRLASDFVQKLLQQAIDKAKADFGKPICVTISDQAGEMLGFLKMDGAPLRSIQISQRKAYTAARMGVSTGAFMERLQRDKFLASDFDAFFTGLPGGTPLKNNEGGIIGAIGVSGLAASEDQAITDFVAGIVSAPENIIRGV
ncbi:MAG: GlcG/HbpS family heme-binding protein [Dissulfurispiraceae bacterium]